MAAVSRRLERPEDVRAARAAALAVGRAGGLPPEQRSALAVAVSDAARRVCGEGCIAVEVEEGTVRFTVAGPTDALRQVAVRCAEVLAGVRLREEEGGEAGTEEGSATPATVLELEHGLPGWDRPVVRAAVEGLAETAEEAGERTTSAGELAGLDFGNREVRELLERLEEKEEALERLDGELEETNRGVVALYAELDERDQRKNEFLATLAHELRNPLGVVRTALHAMRERNGHEEEVSRPLELAERQLRHLARLVDDLLDVSRIDQGKITLRLREVDLAEVVGRALETCRSLMEARGHRLDVELGGEPMPLNADPVRLEQVVDNLLSNAAKYTPEGGHVWVRAHRRGDSAVLEVEDDGIGISDHMLGRIFQRFAQADTTLDRSGGGLGLGLALVERLVTLHGGSVVARSEGEGTGSCFTVFLPVAGARAGAEAQARPALDGAEEGEGTVVWERSRPGEGEIVSAPAVSAATASSAAAASGGNGCRAGTAGAEAGEAAGESATTNGSEDAGPRSILLVEDNDDAREMLALLLEGRGFQVDTARDGAEGVERGSGGGFDAAVVDIGLPGLDGYEVARRLRAAQESADMLLVALSGYGRPEDRERSREAGFDHHLVKPVEPNDLCELLKSGRGGR